MQGRYHAKDEQDAQELEQGFLFRPFLECGYDPEEKTEQDMSMPTVSVK